MFGGKTSALFLALERYKHQRKKIVVFKPAIDDRYDASAVTTHSGWKIPAVAVKTGADVLGYLAELEGDSIDVVAVDEAFMIPDVAEALVWLFRNGFSVIVSTLDLSSSGKPFREVEKMLPWATRVEKCSAVCTVCGSDAFYTHRKNCTGDEIQVGGSELYESRCFRHHLAIDDREDIRRE